MSDAAEAPDQVSDAVDDPVQVSLAASTSVHVSVVSAVGSHFSMALQTVPQTVPMAALLNCTRFPTAETAHELDRATETLTMVTALAEFVNAGDAAADPSNICWPDAVTLAAAAGVASPSRTRCAAAVGVALAAVVASPSRTR